MAIHSKLFRKLLVCTTFIAVVFALGVPNMALAETSDSWAPADGAIVCFTPDGSSAVLAPDAVDKDAAPALSGEGQILLGDPATAETSGSEGLSAQSLQTQATPTNLVPYPLTVLCLQSVARSMLPDVNNLRASVGASALTWDSDLEYTAMLRAAECAIYWSHTRPSGQDCTTAFPSSASGYTGENIAANCSGYGEQESETFQGWRESAGHYANMVNTNYSSIGIGCAALYYGGRWYYFWTQDFAGSTGSGMTTAAVDGYRHWALYVQDDTVTSMDIDPTTIYVGLHSTQSLPTASLTFSGNGSMGYFNIVNYFGPQIDSSFTPLTLSGTNTYSKNFLKWSVSSTDIAEFTTDSLLKGNKVGTDTGTAAFSYSSKDTRTFTIKVHPWTRLSGATRVDTMGAIVDEGFADGACKGGAIILTTAYNYADALAASGLAGILGCPIITTSGDVLSPVASDEISRLQPSTVYILGGSGAVSDAAQTSVEDISGVADIIRISGARRYDTDMAIYGAGLTAGKSGGNGWSDTCIITRGWNYADALAVAPYAYAAKCPIFLAGADGSLSNDVRDAIAGEGVYAGTGGFTHVIVIGGQGGSDAILDTTINGLGLPQGSVIRLAGTNRMATSEAIARWATGEDASAAFQPSVMLSYDGMGVADAWNYPDSLASAGLLGQKRSVLILADTGSDTQNRIDRLVGASSGVNSGYILGGTSSVSYTVETWIGARYL